MSIHAITNTNEYPWELLVLADPEREIIESYLFSSDVFVYQEEKVLGVVVIQKQETSQYEVMNLAVAEDSQGRGIGRLLLTYAINQLESLRKPLKIIIKTGDISGPALNLYQSMGFTVKEVIENYFSERYSEPIYEDGQLLKNQIILEKIV